MIKLEMSSVHVDDTFAWESIFAYVCLSGGWFWDSVLVAISAGASAFAPWEWVVMIFFTNSVVGDSAVSFQGGSECVWIIRVIHA